MYEKIILDMLSSDSVSVITKKYILSEGIEYEVSQPHRKSYINSENGRIELQNELSQVLQDAVFAIWGNVPTVTENTSLL